MMDDASMETKFDDFVNHDGPTQGQTYTAANRDAMAASKNGNSRERINNEV